MDDKEYYVFISYKREDEKWAKWLQDGLDRQRLGLPLILIAWKEPD